SRRPEPARATAGECARSLPRERAARAFRAGAPGPRASRAGGSYRPLSSSASCDHLASSDESQDLVDVRNWIGPLFDARVANQPVRHHEEVPDAQQRTLHLGVVLRGHLEAGTYECRCRPSRRRLDAELQKELGGVAFRFVAKLADPLELRETVGAVDVPVG